MCVLLIQFSIFAIGNVRSLHVALSQVFLPYKIWTGSGNWCASYKQFKASPWGGGDLRWPRVTLSHEVSLYKMLARRDNLVTSYKRFKIWNHHIVSCLFTIQNVSGLRQLVRKWNKIEASPWAEGENLWRQHVTLSHDIMPCKTLVRCDNLVTSYKHFKIPILSPTGHFWSSHVRLSHDDLPCKILALYDN